MDTVDIEIPADAKMVKLALKERTSNVPTLRTVLPLIKGDVELVVAQEFEDKGETYYDAYRLKAPSGEVLVKKLLRSRVVDGEHLLDQVPSIQRQDPTFNLYAGTFSVNTGTGCIQLWVNSPAPDEED